MRVNVPKRSRGRGRGPLPDLFAPAQSEGVGARGFPSPASGGGKGFLSGLSFAMKLGDVTKGLIDFFYFNRSISKKDLLLHVLVCSKFDVLTF